MPQRSIIGHIMSSANLEHKANFILSMLSNYSYSYSYYYLYTCASS